MSEEWDNLLLLDACRLDQFRHLNTIEGTLEIRTSLGSATPEFLRKNFRGATYHDTVYVTANPMYQTENLDDVFHSVIDVWLTDWNNKLGTVHPEDMATATLKAYREYPNKRILAHFMQPHYPFIGDYGRQIGDHAGYRYTMRRVNDEEVVRDYPTVWELLEAGKVAEDLVWKAYNENLEIALEQVEELVREFSEKTVVTSDHGNLFGKRLAPFTRPLYGHQTGAYTDELCQVPWLVVDGETRKRLTTEESRERSGSESDVVEERLNDLGYMDL